MRALPAHKTVCQSIVHLHLLFNCLKPIFVEVTLQKCVNVQRIMKLTAEKRNRSENLHPTSWKTQGTTR